MYEKGTGGDEDRVKARNWFKEAAEHGHQSAALLLATMCEKGEGGDQEKEAKKWYKLSAKTLTEAAYNLGRLYFDENKKEKAAKWFRVAAEKRNPEAAVHLGHYYCYREREEKSDDYIEARR